MARSKPNKLKSPHKQKIEEHNNKDKTEKTPHITPQLKQAKQRPDSKNDQSRAAQLVRKIFGTRKTSLITTEIQATKEPTAVIEINTNWTKTDRPSIPLTANLCSPRTKTLKATSSQTKESKEKEWPMFNELQAKKTASQQRNQKMKRSLYLPSNPETDSLNDTMNRNK
jgi:hypothetical protein